MSPHWTIPAQTKGPHPYEGQGHIRPMVLISDRPAEIEDRAIPGHWEGDLIMGRGKSSIGTLVERSTRYVMLFALEKPTAENVRVEMTKKIMKLPAQLRKSITWDQGTEMAQHRQFTIDSGIQVYFCNPRSPWQRGSNENTNGLLRQYLPKGTDTFRLGGVVFGWDQVVVTVISLVAVGALYGLFRFARLGAGTKTQFQCRLMRLRVMPELKSAAGNPDHSNPPLKQRP